MAGDDTWNEWRVAHPTAKIDLLEADLRRASFRDANLKYAHLTGGFLRSAVMTRCDLTRARLQRADLRDATLLGAKLNNANLEKAVLTRADLRNAECPQAFFVDAHMPRVRFQAANLTGARMLRVGMRRADLREVNLTGADLGVADLRDADLRGANLTSANLQLANLTGANLSGAILREANLQGAQLIQSNLDGADMSGAHVYGVSAWGLKLKATVQKDLIITNTRKLVHPFRSEGVITVDNLEVAQVVYLMLKNEKVRDVLDTLSTKVVLILGRFTNERKAVLDAVREELRKHNFVPVLFDFEKPKQRDITETVSVLAHMAKFVIADITDARSIPQELKTIVPALPSVPVQPILQAGAAEYGMFEHFKKFPWVLKTHEYKDTAQLVSDMPKAIVEPAIAKSEELKS